MSMISYIDGVGRVSIVNGIAHIDLVNIIPPTKDGEQPQVMVAHRIAMALPQMIRMCADIAGHMQRMEQQGIFKRTDGAQPTG